jgi:predicted AlkP superfamily pyrophosphatase or phosphodiesterase
MTTAFFSEKQKFQMFVDSYDDINGDVDLIGEDNGRNKIDFSSIIDTWNNPAVILSFVQQIHSNHFNYSFIHIADMDYAGHYYGWGTEIWYEQLEIVDQCLGWIFNIVDSDEEFSGKTAIILTADHGEVIRLQRMFILNMN